MLIHEVLPKNVLDNSIYLMPWGIDNYAYNSEIALKVVEKLRENCIPIIGGDVLEILSSSDIVHTYDNWYISNKENAVEVSCNTTIEKIHFYSKKYPGKNIIFSLIV